MLPVLQSIRDAVLADFDWNFATKNIALADTNNPPQDWIMRIPIPLTASVLLRSRFLAYGIRRLLCACSMWSARIAPALGD